mmetsp:Transcript_3922/g.5204  ORF Transcript_3922/g.5204 Transcript_3922/m.5204 type:complete len:180 (-) Transcript_3922:120-659(-)
MFLFHFLNSFVCFVVSHFVVFCSSYLHFYYFIIVCLAPSICVQTHTHTQLPILSFFSMLWPKNTRKQKYKWGYQPIGQRKYIQFDNSTYTILDDTDGAYDAERVRKFEEKTFLKYEEFIEAHRSDCEGGYFRAIAPEVCVETKGDVVAIQDEEEYTWMVKEDVAFELEEDAMVTTAIAI